MRRNLLNDLIELHLRALHVVNDHGTLVMRRRAFTIPALTNAVNDGPPIVRVRGKRHRPFEQREVQEALLSRSSLIVSRLHRPSGETLYKWVDASDQEWAKTNGQNGGMTIHRTRERTPRDLVVQYGRGSA